MKFSCALETASDSIRLVKVVSYLIKADYRLMSQRQEPSKKGGHVIYVVAESMSGKPQDTIIEDLSSIEGCTLLKIKFAESKSGAKSSSKSGTQSSGATPSNTSASADPVSIAEEKRVLAKIGEKYPKIVPIVKSYAASLESDVRNERLRTLGSKVGAGIYQRDYDLGSPLKISKALSRELRPALKEFCKVETDEQSVVLMNCPFCADKSSDPVCCEFVAGYISGFLGSNPAVGQCEVSETNCGSETNNDCTFFIDV
ncbi:hypothetical protein [Arenicella xantha]|uniref:Putative hydrocarbon binding protein n=1 Tax=Arenicella xantha TaxID=644221 RepID=A0A395JL59_9GAMM|nr:hypothetical protein [Arenicella xantha]RBP51165.1 putative hydrocarbon binding protein [Arenicella xantha]